MNTLLIENLSDQADVDTRQIASRVSHLSPWKKRFAELIIEECLAHGKLARLQVVDNGSDEYNSGREMRIEVFMNQIKLHFGMKS